MKEFLIIQVRDAYAMGAIVENFLVGPTKEIHLHKNEAEKV